MSLRSEARGGLYLRPRTNRGIPQLERRPRLFESSRGRLHQQAATPSVRPARRALPGLLRPLQATAAWCGRGIAARPQVRRRTGSATQ